MLMDSSRGQFCGGIDIASAVGQSSSNQDHLQPSRHALSVALAVGVQNNKVNLCTQFVG
jgi:hypothetical protein